MNWPEDYIGKVIHGDCREVMRASCRICGVCLGGNRKIYCSNKCRTATYKLRHPDRVKASNKEQYWKFREKRLNDNAKWRKENKEYLKEYCAKRDRKKYNQSNRKEYMRKWREVNKDKVKESYKRGYAKHKDEMKIKNSLYHKLNSEKIRLRKAKRRKENPTLGRIYNHNRAARIKKNGGTLSKDIVNRLSALQKNKCAICKTNLKKTGHHLDHIIPIDLGGANEDKNVQLTCPKCNLKKRNKDPIEFMQSLGYLL